MTEMTHPMEPLQPPRPGAGSVEDQAEAWLVYLYSGSATEAGRRQFSQWLRESPRHAAAYANAEQLWRDLGLVADTAQAVDNTAGDTASPNARAATVITPFVQRNMQTSRAADATARRHRFRATFAVAATLVAAFAIAWFQWFDSTTRYATATGEIETVELADGSVVTLSGASSIVAHISDLERRVELVSGRAYFDVVPDNRRVFRVKAAATEIRVVGTEFDVNKGPDGVRVSVTEGLVKIADAAPANSKGTSEVATGEIAQDSPDKSPAPRRQLELEAGQQLLASLDGTLLGEPEIFDPGEALSWKKGRLHYINTPLDTVVDEVNRYRENKIVLADENLGDFRVTTSFKTDQTDQLLSGLAKSYPVQIARSPDSVTVYAR